MIRYPLRTDKAAQSLRWLLACVLYAADWAVRAGDCEPARVIAEVRRALDLLRFWWGSKPRSVVLGERPVWQRVTQEGTCAYKS